MTQDQAGPRQAETFPQLFTSIVASRGNADAVVVAGRTLTYDELDRETARMARALLAIGAGKGARVALMASDGVFFLTTFYAALRIGALITPISTMATPKELAHILRNSDIQIFIGLRGFLRHDYTKTLTAALPGLEASRADVIRLTSVPYLRSLWLNDADGIGWARPVDELLAHADGPDAPDAEILAAVEREVAPDDDAFIVYTSGSTATPKAVVHSQRSIGSQPAALAALVGLEAHERVMPLLPAFWMGGISSVLQILAVGAAVVYPATPDVETVLDTMEECGVTRVIVWHMLAKLRAAGVARGLDVDGLLGLGAPPRDEDGAIIPPELRTNMLGMSESFAQHSAECGLVPLPFEKAGASGRAVNGMERRVVDQETGLEVPRGQVGELQLRGGALMTGFYKGDRRKTFTPEGFYATSDLVRMDEEDYVYFVGRTGDMIKTNSANVSRLEVEAAMQALPEVDLAVVAGLPDAQLGEIVAAAVVPAQGASPTEEGLKLALRDTLSAFKVPRHIIFVAHDDIPRTATGKLRLFDLGTLISSRIDRE